MYGVKPNAPVTSELLNVTAPVRVLNDVTPPPAADVVIILPLESNPSNPALLEAR